MRSIAAIACLVAALGCEPASSPHDAAGAAKPSTPTAVFPAPADLAKLPSLPAPPEAFGVDAVAVDTWNSLSAPPAQDDATAYDDPSSWGGLTRSIAAGQGDTLRLSPALRCAAGEVARFYAEKGGLPTESLRRFLVARCGSTAPDAVPIASSVDVPDGVADDAVYEHMSGPFRSLLEKNLGSGRRALGLATGRHGRRFAVVAVLGRDEVRFEAFSRQVNASRQIVLRGSLVGHAASVLALINRGDFGSAPCEPDLRFKLPEFAFSCELAEGDKSAWAQVMTLQEGRVLGEAAADVLVSEGDPAQLEYHPRVLGAPMPIASPAAMSFALMQAINKVRAEGKLPPLSMASKESEESARLAGTMIDATLKKRADEADRIGLGLLAGWSVEGTIRNGGLFMGLVAPTRDALVWLAFALERPFGRSVLLDPSASRIAIGPALPPGDAQALGAVVSTYALFESTDHAGDAARLLGRINAGRAAFGKPPLATVDVRPDMSNQTRLVLAGEREPMAALDAGMRSLARRTFGGTVHGFVAEANDLDRVPIPDQLLSVPKGVLAVEVTHHRVRGAAWGQYAVFYILVLENGTNWQ
jgi:hypothetical protein